MTKRRSIREWCHALRARAFALGVVAISGAVALGCAGAAVNPAQGEMISDPAAVYKVPLTGREPTKGPGDALVTIVELSDFQCPFCARVQPAIQQVLERYGSDIRLVWMNNPLPFHEHAYAAATAALAVFEQGGNEAFWVYQQQLLRRQRELSNANLIAWAVELKLDGKKVKAAMDRDRYAPVLSAQMRLAKNLGATGTPAFFINGRFLAGALPVASFAKVIDEELERAKALVREGTPRAQVYARAIADGKTRPQRISNPDWRGGPIVPIGAAPPTAPSKGGAQAKVVIQEFSDFQCPFCKRALPTLRQIEERYGDRVKIVWRNYPLPMHPDAWLAAEAAMEVYAQGGNAKFWAYHDVLFAHQQALSRADLERYAQRLGGIDMARMRRALDSGVHTLSVRADMDAVRAARVRIGTPSFFINGVLIQGAQPWSVFEAAIDRALADAK